MTTQNLAERSANPTSAGGGKDEKQAFTVVVSYNGLSKTLEANPQAAVQALLQHAIQQHGITQNPHILSLYTEAGAELNDHASLADQGVERGALLLLRPGAVKGGGR